MRSTSSHLLLFLILFLGIGWASTARADILMNAKSIDLPGLSMQTVTLNIQAATPSGLQLQLHAAHATIAAMGWNRVGLNLDGHLHRDDQLRWIFEGTVKLANAPGGALSHAKVTMTLSESADTLLLNILQGDAQASTALPLDQPTHAQITLDKVPVTWLQGLLGNVWSGHTTAGHLTAKLAVDVGGDGVQSSGEFSLEGGGFDTPGGTLAGQSLDASGRFGLDSSVTPAQIELDASLHGGQLLLGSIYAHLPKASVRLGLHASVGDGEFALDRLRVDDPNALQLKGALSFNAHGELKSLRFDHIHANFPQAYQRYGKAWLDTLGVPDMLMDGEVTGSVDLRRGDLHSFAFKTDRLDMKSTAGTFAVNDLHGGLDWAAQGQRQATTLGWAGSSFYKVANGAMHSQWLSHDGILSLQKPMAVPVFGGQLRVSSLNWRPAAEKGQRLDTSLLMTGINLAVFSRAMGWPAFPGTLAGSIPSLRWVDNRFELSGGLSASLFDGFVDVTRLSLEHPFGPDPVLMGDVHLQQLDLAEMTSVFNFGNITGKLDGSIDSLRLVDWSPVAFKASLLADSGGRISQRAVNNLTAVGGGGIAGGLQGVVLKLFKTFGYKRIGLNCTLQASVCQMSGLEPDDDGYTIVEGSGLPYLQVIGHERRVDWPTLVRRLHAAIEGAAPEVR